MIVACVLAVATALLCIPAGAGAARHARRTSWQLWSAAAREPLGAPVRAAVEQAGHRGAARDAAAALPVGSRAGAQHRPSERPEPAARQQRPQELRGVRARPGRGLGDAVRGDLHRQRPDDDRPAPAPAEEVPDAGRRLDGVDAVLGPASLLDRTHILRQITRSVVTGRVQIARLERSLRRLVRGTARLDTGLEQARRRLERPRQRSWPGRQRLEPDRRRDRGSGPPDPAARKRGAGDGHGGQPTRGRKRPGEQRRQAAPEGDRRADASPHRGEPRLRHQAQRPARHALSRMSSRRCAASARRAPPLRPIRSCSAPGRTSRMRSQPSEPCSRTSSSYATELDANTAAAKEISRGMERLVNGLAQIASGSAQLDSGIARTASGATQLASGAGVLNAGVAAAQLRHQPAAQWRPGGQRRRRGPRRRPRPRERGGESDRTRAPAAARQRRGGETGERAPGAPAAPAGNRRR